MSPTGYEPRTRSSQRRLALRNKPLDVASPHMSLSDAERLWEPHIQAFRKGRLKLTDFCKERGLDPQQMRPFLTSHYRRAKGEGS